MTDGPPLGPLSSLDPILCPGGPRSKLLLPDPALKLNIGALPLLRRKSLRFKLYVLCDNMSTVALAHNPIKHMKLDLFFVWEKVINKLLQVIHVPIVDQCVDILTKALSPTHFLTLQTKLKVIKLTCVNTPQQNGVAEQKNRHLLEVAKALPSQMYVRNVYWGEAVLTATYLKNRLLTHVLQEGEDHKEAEEEDHNKTKKEDQFFGIKYQKQEKLTLIPQQIESSELEVNALDDDNDSTKAWSDSVELWFLGQGFHDHLEKQEAEMPEENRAPWLKLDYQLWAILWQSTCYSFWTNARDVFAYDVRHLFDSTQKLVSLQQTNHDMVSHIAKARAAANVTLLRKQQSELTNY
ncbi:hypothetical protein CR513_01250, partial [Mucuna pruriens]